MKQTLIFIFLSVFCYLSLVNAWDSDVPKVKEVSTEKKVIFPKRFKKLPVGDNVYLSSGITDTTFIDYLYSKGVESIYRLNGDGYDAKGQLSIHQEATKCDKKIYFQRYNIDGGDSIEPIVKQLHQGNALIHCKNGAHRAALIVGCFMISKGKTYQEVIKFIRWEKIQYNENYKIYVDQLKMWNLKHSKFHIQRRQNPLT